MSFQWVGGATPWPQRGGADKNRVQDVLTLRNAKPEDCPAATDLCLRSKAVWGYSAEFMARCRAELSLTPEMLERDDAQIAEWHGCILGVAQVSSDGDQACLEKLFVDPDAMGRGVGRVLFGWARTAARKRGAATLVIEADPEAAPFYRRLGAVDAGTVPSVSIPGRSLPRLTVPLTE